MLETSTSKHSPSLELTRSLSEKHPDGPRLEYKTLGMEKVPVSLQGTSPRQDVEDTFVMETCSEKAKRL